MIIAGRQGMMGGREPYDVGVEFLESTGTQYIDTLVNADSNLSVEVTMANTGTTWTNVNPMGALCMAPRYRHHINFPLDGKGILYYFGGDDSCYVDFGYRPSTREVFTFKVDAINKTFILGSFVGAIPGASDAFDTGVSYWLFGRNGSNPPHFGSYRIYSVKMWNVDTLVFDGIPVRKGTVGYMYDKVSGKLFGNQGTGEFILGTDL